MCFQDDAPDTKKHFTGDPVQDGSLPGECCSSFHLRSCSPLSLSTNRDACWFALDSLWSCDLNFLKIFLVRGDLLGGNLTLSVNMHELQKSSSMCFEKVSPFCANLTFLSSCWGVGGGGCWDGAGRLELWGIVGGCSVFFGSSFREGRTPLDRVD